MIILRANQDGMFGEIKIRKGVDYVMADAIAQSVKENAPHIIERADPMTDEYKAYNGEDLTGKSLVMWRTGGFGDLLFVSSLVHHLKMKYPEAKIDVATSERFHDIWVGNKDIPSLTSPGVLPIPLSFLTAHDYQLKFEGTIEADTDPNQLPAVERFSALAKAKLAEQELIPYYPGAMTHFTTARNALRKYNLNLRPMEYICLQFKSSSIVRDWRYTRMIELADRLAEKYDMPVLMMGNDFYHDKVKEASEKYIEEKGGPIHPKAVDITPTNLRFLYSSALIAKAKFVVTIDSALVHVAAATFTPCVSLYGPFPGKIRTKYYNRNITLENKGSCIPYPDGCLQHTQAGPGNILPTQTHCGEKIEVCKMMDSIHVSHVIDAVDDAMDKWGHETETDRLRMFKEREAYEPEGAKKVVAKSVKERIERPKAQRTTKKKRNRNKSRKKNRRK